jgi:urease accessory protein
MLAIKPDVLKALNIYHDRLFVVQSVLSEVHSGGVYWLLAPALFYRNSVVNLFKEIVINTQMRPKIFKIANVQPRARGAVKLSVKATDFGTGIRNLRQSGSFKAVFPRSRTNGIETVLVNTAGGVTGGDTFETDICAESKTRLSVTTQAAERAYCAQRGEIALINSRLELRGTARLDWLPQETILFNNCAFERSLRVAMDAQSTLLLVEALVFGRTAMGEALGQCHFKDRIEIVRDGSPLFVDSIMLNGDATKHLARPNIAGGAGAMASVIYVSPDADTYLSQVRPLLTDTSGASMIRDQLLYIRVLANDGFKLRQTLVPILECLNNSSLPRSWML